MAASSGGKVKGENLNNKLWVGNLDKRLSEYNLLNILQRFGDIESFELLFHKSGVKEGEPRGYCFVEFKTREQAENALQGLNGKLALSKPLVVNWAKKKPAGNTGMKGQGEKNILPSAVSSKSSLNSCESKIKAIETKLKLMESGQDSQSTALGRHPLLVQSQKARTHPYKKPGRYGRGSSKQTR